MPSQNWRKSKEYRQWRIAVIRRDKTCVICGSRSQRQAHHLEDASYHPGKRYDVDNGVCLCRFHHTMFHTSYKNSFREKTTVKDWLNFLELLNKVKAYAKANNGIICKRINNDI